MVKFTRAWKRSNGQIFRFTESEAASYAAMFTEMGAWEIEVGGPEDIDLPPTCEHGDCSGEHTMAVAEVHVQGSSGTYHLWVCVGHLQKDFHADDVCNCPGRDKAHEKCNCLFCEQGENPKPHRPLAEDLPSDGPDDQ